MANTKWYEIIRKNPLTSMQRVDCISYNTPYVVEFNDYGRRIGSKTTPCNISILINGKKESLNINGWNLSEPIQVKKCEWDNSCGHHYYVEISIKCPTEDTRTIKLYTSFNEGEMITRVMETLGILFMCQTLNEFQGVMVPIMDKNNIIDWRLALSGDRLWRFAQAVNRFDFHSNPFSEHLYKYPLL